ncbi:hypothetical protein N7G274_008869 [Stereocaulon virgatum]|uniref:Autophagy-related protein 101 n=1 Tax=Stereocaulon virgatum TaxID=373712 RepID=A0ABR3ZZ98_9LECA
MEHRKPPQYILEVFADPTCVKDIVRGILHTIFFHRYLSPLRPSYLEVLEFTLPLVADPDLETLIDTRVGQLIRQLSSTSSPKSSVRGSLVVEFFEKKRRKDGVLGWFGAKGEEGVCWESWCLEVTLATPKTEIERTKVTEAIGSTLQKTAMQVVTIVNRDKNHIPPLTTNEGNPFPFHIELSPRVEGWGRSIGIF